MNSSSVCHHTVNTTCTQLCIVVMAILIHVSVFPLVDKEEMRRKREDVVKAVQEKMEQEQMERATKKREAEKLAIKQQMQVQ